jgi:signal peptidase I
LSQKAYNSPGLFISKADELSLSGQALLDIMQVVLAKDIPFRFKAKGWSMIPFIRDGDVITIAPISYRLPGVGDVVAFKQPDSDRLVVHRIIKRKEAYLYIHGDGIADQSDGLIHSEDMIGQVTRIERKGKRVWLGLGPERYLIALLSRRGLLIPICLHISRCRRKIT